MWWIYLTIFIAAAALQIVIHELSHCIVVWKNGGKVLSFKPYPHRVDGHWYFGRMTYTTKEPLSNNQQELFYFAPLHFANIAIIVYYAGALFYPPLIIATLAPLIDVINWGQGAARKSNNDGGKYRELVSS